MGMTDYIQPGETVLYGKFKNRPALVVRFFRDDRGVPMVELEPVPKGRKSNRIMSLFTVWKLPANRAEATATKIAGRYVGRYEVSPDSDDLAFLGLRQM